MTPPPGAVLDRPDVTRSTMMGLPCLRTGGAFFAACDRRTGNLLVKLPRDRVDTLVASGHAEPFAPAGRRFREWAAVPHADVGTWPDLLDEALAFVAASGGSGQARATRRRSR